MPTTTANRLKELIRRLLEGTRASRLEWQVTAEENTFRLASRSANARITSEARYHEEAGETLPYRCVENLNDKGRVLEEYFANDDDVRKDFYELFALARRSALKTDEVLDKLLSEIGPASK